MWNVTSLGQPWVSPPVDSPGGVVRCTCRTHARSRADEVQIQVAASGVGYWEDVVRSGDWDVGGALPMALGVETAGTVTAVGSEVTVFGVGDEVLTHCVPLREQGAWAEQAICAAADCACKPPGVAWSDAAVFPVPALTAAQVVDDALAVQPGETLLVHGAGGVTGRLIVQLAVVRGARVIATAGPASAEAVRSVGAAEVVDYHDARWPERVRGTRGRVGVAVHQVYVRPDGPRLAALAELLARGELTVEIGAGFPLEQASDALDMARSGGHGKATVVYSVPL
jgi:NADPH:quinone reductase-like Zn-dependent oxidoreductase